MDIHKAKELHTKIKMVGLSEKLGTEIAESRDYGHVIAATSVDESMLDIDIPSIIESIRIHGMEPWNCTLHADGIHLDSESYIRSSRFKVDFKNITVGVEDENSDSLIRSYPASIFESSSISFNSISICNMKSINGLFALVKTGNSHTHFTIPSDVENANNLFRNADGGQFLLYGDKDGNRKLKTACHMFDGVGTGTILIKKMNIGSINIDSMFNNANALAIVLRDIVINGNVYMTPNTFLDSVFGSLIFDNVVVRGNVYCKGKAFTGCRKENIDKRFLDIKGMVIEG